VLFEIGEEDEIQYADDKKHDFDRPLKAGYIEPGPRLPKYKLSAKGEGMIEDRGGGINEARDEFVKRDVPIYNEFISSESRAI
jgi:hypothetical protein